MMATTLNLLQVTKRSSRVEGAISWIRCFVLLDGVEVDAEFRARVGEEPIVIEGDTITVSDAQVASLRASTAATVAFQADRAARQGAAIEAARAKLEGFITTKGFDDAVAAELRAHFEASGSAVVMTEQFGVDRRYEAYTAGVRAIAARAAR